MIKILLVDDDMLTRKYIKQMTDWSKHGITIVGEAVHGKQALSMILELKPDIALVDVSMPVMDGIELAKIVAEKGLDVKLIMLSCREDILYVKQAMKAGASDYILKHEVELQLLLDIINSVAREKDILVDKRNTAERFVENIPFSLKNEEQENLIAALRYEDVTYALDKERNDISNKEIRDAIDYIHKNYSKNISLEDVAKHVNLSKVYLSQLFLDKTKKNFSKYLLDLRLEKARDLLNDTNMKVYTVAEKAGFNNQYYFIKAFKKKYGITPKKYRNYKN